MAKTTIEWTQSSWNPVTGCSKISLGCENCYAERMAVRLCAMGRFRYRNGFRVTLHPDMVEVPLGWRVPQMVFVNSMSDLFHHDVPDAFIRDVFSVMCEASQHTFQVLTKRAERLGELSSCLPWPSNVWMGVTVENADYLWRLERLRLVPARVRFVSLEPLLGPMEDMSLDGVDWVIAGGESGPGSRPMAAEWVRSIRDLCVREGVPFFFKQWGGFRKKLAGRLLDGVVWSQYPDPGRSPAGVVRGPQASMGALPSVAWRGPLPM